MSDTTTSLPEIIARALHAANTADTTTFLECFSPHRACVIDWGQPFHGRAAIQRWSDEHFIGQQVHLEVIDTITTERGAILIAHTGGNGFNGPSTLTFTLDDDFITELRLSP